MPIFGKNKTVDLKALIFAAGLGTRLMEHTSNKPKALVQLAGKPLLQHAIERLASHGITDITVNVYHFADQVISFLESHPFPGVQVLISDEREALLDTGGGLKKAASFLSGNESILLYNVDVISNLDLKMLEEAHLLSGALVTVVVRQRETSRYMMFDPSMQLAGWKNFSNGETKISRPDTFDKALPFAFSGIQIIRPELFTLITEQGKFPIMDLYLRLAQTEKIQGYLDHSTIWMDLGKPDQLIKAEEMMRKKD
ncbi:MAG TPA: nucleotidyltransferase family protein [Prolixibacteraceae bacterium]|nr:nucleotidyltransferase family protein [Prolixibacteraceae bacterium]